MNVFWYRCVHKIHNLCNKLLAYLQLQLFLTLCSWPILLWWGLPLSAASIIGNFIFVPFLTLFLVLSSFIFFCELLFIPSILFSYPLEWLTISWVWLLSMGKRSWLISCPLPPYGIALLVPLTACLVIHHKKIITPAKSCLALFLLLLSWFLLFKGFAATQEKTIIIPCFGKELTLVCSQNRGMLIDDQVIGRRISAPSWARYTLAPLLTKQGITELEIVTTKPTAMTFKALSAIMDVITVKKLYIPAKLSWPNNQALFTWQKLLSACKRHGAVCERINKKKCLIFGNHELTLEIDTVNKHLVVVKVI